MFPPRVLTHGSPPRREARVPLSAGGRRAKCCSRDSRSVVEADPGPADLAAPLERDPCAALDLHEVAARGRREHGRGPEAAAADPVAAHPPHVVPCCPPQPLDTTAPGRSTRSH